MARYGSRKYGTFKYGAETISRKLTWILEVDWNNDGAFNGDNEALRASDLSIRRGRTATLNSNSNGFETVTPGELQITLENEDGRYNPFNESSPIYPNVVPGSKFSLRVLDENTGTTYNVISGNVKRIDEVVDALGSNKIILSGVDRYELMQYDSVVSTLQTDIAFEDAIQNILTAIDWEDGVSLEESNETIPYWWASGETATKEIATLVDASLGKFFVGADGTATYLSRLVGHAAVETLTETDILRGIRSERPWDVVRNDVDIVVSTRVLGTSTDLWTLGDVPLVTAGNSLNLWVNYYSNFVKVPAQDVINPVATTDFLANSLADGTGTNLTANFSVTSTIYADRAYLTVTNNGATNGYLTLLKIRGKPLSTTPLTLNEANQTSIDRYHRRKFIINTNWNQDVNNSEDMLTVLSSYLTDVQTYPTVRLIDTATLQFTPELFDVVLLDFPSKNVYDRYVVKSIEHKWKNKVGDVVETTFSFEPELVPNGQIWIFTAQLGVNTVFAG